jgi:hypothetical protein
MDQLSLLEKAANTLGRARAAYDLPLLKALQVDGIGRTLPMSGFTMMGASGPSFINFDQTCRGGYLSRAPMMSGPNWLRRGTH